MACLDVGHEDDGAEARGSADADRREGWLDVLHSVVNCETGADGAARGIDVDLDLLLRVVRGEVDELRHHQVGDHVVDGPADENDSVFEQARVDVERSLAVAALVLGDGRDVSHSTSLYEIYSEPLVRAAPMAPV